MGLKRNIPPLPGVKGDPCSVSVSLLPFLQVFVCNDSVALNWISSPLFHLSTRLFRTRLTLCSHFQVRLFHESVQALVIHTWDVKEPPRPRHSLQQCRNFTQRFTTAHMQPPSSVSRAAPFCTAPFSRFRERPIFLPIIPPRSIWIKAAFHKHTNLPTPPQHTTTGVPCKTNQSA